MTRLAALLLGVVIILPGPRPARSPAPHELLVAVAKACDCEENVLPVLRALDPETGVSRALFADPVGGEFRLIGVGLEGSVAALNSRTGRVHYADRGRRFRSVPPLPIGALDALGDVLFGDRSLERYRVRLQRFESVTTEIGEIREIDVGPAGEIVVLFEDESVARFDPVDGARADVAAAGFARTIAVEPSGSVVGIRGDDLMRVDATGTIGLVAEDVAPAGADAQVAVLGDGTIFLGASGTLIRVDPASGAASSQAVDFELDGLTALLGVLCPEEDGRCAEPPPECEVAEDCSDGLFCAAERCDEGVCEAGPAPCRPGLCDEGRDICLDCTSPLECGDGLFCTGDETCADGFCIDGPPPCGASQVCDEDADLCRGPLDFDLKKAQADRRLALSKGKRSYFRLKARNIGASSGTVFVHVVAEQNGVTLFDETSPLYTGRQGNQWTGTSSVLPTAPGLLVWTVVIEDEDPDADTATRSVEVVE